MYGLNIMGFDCTNLLTKLQKSIDEVNYELIDVMTDENTSYRLVCIKPQLTFKYYSERLKNKWESIISDFMAQPTICNYSTLKLIMQIQKKVGFETLSQDPRSIKISLSDKEIQEKFIDYFIESIEGEQNEFHFNEDVKETIWSIINIFKDHCQCYFYEILKIIISKYQKKYANKDKFKKMIISEINKGPEDNIKGDMKRAIIALSKKSEISAELIEEESKKITQTISERLTKIYNLTIEDELDILIPNELGSLKEFFIKVITTYYKNLHPVVWAQMYKQIITNIFIELPISQEEFFQFLSKQLLLNSGPFILKILQMIRPILTRDQAKKYNLEKLTYPTLEKEQINLILNKILPEYNLYQILLNRSASVGHVCIMYRVDEPKDIFVIKIIKPLSIVQSCWEYQTLYNLFPKKSCEQTFVENMLESNGREMNVENEKNNIKKGKEYYSGDYSIFSNNFTARLTTIDVKEGVTTKDCWFAFAMTLAPGVTLAELVENADKNKSKGKSKNKGKSKSKSKGKNKGKTKSKGKSETGTEIESESVESQDDNDDDLLKKDSKYRAKLHRCLDILVYKFFYNLVQNGFYHGDLHAGNIFFSYEKSQMTLIDFGAVGEIDIYRDDEDVKTFLDVIILSFFYNYDEMLDAITLLVNSKCKDSRIDDKSGDYNKFRKKMTEYKKINIMKFDEYNVSYIKYQKDLFSDSRIKEEMVSKKSEESNVSEIESQDVGEKSIYSLMENIKRETGLTEFEKSEVRNDLIFEEPSDSETISITTVFKEIFEFYALKGVNIAIKLNNFYELQKAYTLILGVLFKVHYNSYRINMVIEKAILSWSHIRKLSNIRTAYNVVTKYYQEQKKYESNKEIIKQAKKTT